MVRSIQHLVSGEESLVWLNPAKAKQLSGGTGTGDSNNPPPPPPPPPIESRAWTGGTTWG